MNPVFPGQPLPPKRASGYLKVGAILVASLLAAAAITGVSARAATDASKPAGGSTFSLLPKSFQKDPPVHMTVITEMTVDGGKLPTPTAARPMYFLSDVLGYHDEGTGFGEKKIIPPERLQAYLEKSLAGKSLSAGRCRPSRHPRDDLLVGLRQQAG